MHPYHFGLPNRRHLASPAASQSRMHTNQPSRRDGVVMQQNFRELLGLDLEPIAASAVRVEAAASATSIPAPPRCLNVDHHLPRLVCPGCSQGISRFSDLKAHMKRSCSGREHLYRCGECGTGTLSKEYGKAPSKHEWKEEYIYLPKHFGCPCCVTWCKDFKTFQQHVLDESHDMNKAFFPDGAGHVNRLRGLLMQPRVKSIVEQYCSGSQLLAGWLTSIHWGVNIAKEFADKLEHRYISVDEGLQELGLPDEDLPRFVGEVFSRGHMQSPAQTIVTQPGNPPPGNPPSSAYCVPATAVATQHKLNGHRHKRMISLTSYELPEGATRARAAPELPKEKSSTPAARLSLRLKTVSLEDVPSLDSSPQTPSPFNELNVQPFVFDESLFSTEYDASAFVGYQWEEYNTIAFGQAI